MGALIDRYLIVDWSAANTPKTGKDSIWFALHDGTQVVRLENPRTRVAAMESIKSICRETISSGDRLLAGFDFAFGWPEGATASLLSPQSQGYAAWQHLWRFLAENIEDHENNNNNAFELAGRLNQNGAPFWGHPHQHKNQYPGLGPRKPVGRCVPEWRQVERVAKGAKSVWQLAYNGAVGRQSLLGIAHLEKLRKAFAGDVAVWPFEPLDKPLMLAEIYPSLFNVKPKEREVLDAAQVRTLAERFAALDAEGRLEPLLEVPDASRSEEGWIIGAACPSIPDAGGHSRRKQAHYTKDPAEIYAQSFATIEAEVDFTDYTPAMAKVVTRLVHACGMTDIVDDLAFSDGAAEAGIAALKTGVPVFCDVEMVKSGIITRFLADPERLHCTLNDPRVAGHANAISNTRSAAAVDFWDELEGSICVIGNAPTALFRLLERMDEGAGRPALIVGIPVGFVGAVESKAELVANPRGCPFITVHGRRGGSAMASSVVNALAGLV
ncbi:MAG: precorrin-8X methylmutase [Pseudomonadota bacterium]